MPTPRPAYIKGNYYHFYNRGAHKLSIFRDEDNYQYVIRKIKEHSRNLNITVIPYCLLPNHYHFLLRQDGEFAARLLPQYVFNSYSKAYNKRYAHSGTIFEGSYKAKEIKIESHLLHLCRYIHANPVIHSIISEIDVWPFSNYLHWVGLRGGTLLDEKFIDAYFPTRWEYVKFVQEYIEERKMPEELSGYLNIWEK